MLSSKSLNFRHLLFLVLSFSFVSSGSLAEITFKVPAFTAAVVDQTQMLSPSTRSQLEASLRAINRSTATQIAVLIVPDLGGLGIEQASIQVVDQWKLGSDQADKNKLKPKEDSRDRGVLLLIAKKERRLRIEVGRGLEGSITDAYAKRIISETMEPLMKSGQFDQAVTLGVYQIAQKANPTIDMKSAFSSNFQQQRRGARRVRPLSTAESIFILLIFLVLIFTRTGRQILLFMLIFGGRGGRGGGGGGFGGGGGGGFSGGGASGGW